MALRYSGNATARVLWNDRTDRWDATVSAHGRNVWRGWIGRAPADRRSVDAPEAYDDAARTAFSSADETGDVQLAWGNQGVLVSRSKTGASFPFTRINRSGGVARPRTRHAYHLTERDAMAWNTTPSLRARVIARARHLAKRQGAPVNVYAPRDAGIGYPILIVHPNGDQAYGGPLPAKYGTRHLA